LAGRRTGYPLGSGKTGCNGPIGTSRPVPTPPELDSAPVDVQVIKPTRRDLVYTVKLPANVSPLYQTTLYAKVAGYLKWIGPDKGDAVKKNEVVAVIDAPEVEEQYQQAVSDYKIKKLTYERLAKVWKESPDVIAKQDVDVAEATLSRCPTPDGATGRHAGLHQGPCTLRRHRHRAASPIPAH
jgi:multidrug efflux pump subunit AcrA (membrane-fusion protein)